MPRAVSHIAPPLRLGTEQSARARVSLRTRADRETVQRGFTRDKSGAMSESKVHRIPMRVACAVLMLLATWPSSALGQDAPVDAEKASARRNVLSTNPVRYGILHFQIEYERIIGERFGVFVAPIYFHHATWYPFARAHEMTANGGGLDLGFRYTFGARAAPAGFYVGPILSAYRGEVLRAGVTTLEGFVFSGGAQAGYTWLVDWLLLSPGIGLSYGIPTERAPEGSAKAAQLPHQGLWINFRANVGFTF